MSDPPILVFSDKPLYRLSRHGVFLVGIAAYFFVSYLAYRTPFSLRVSDWDYARLSLVDAVGHTVLATVLIYPTLYGYLPRLFRIGPSLWLLLLIMTTGELGLLFLRYIVYPFREQIGYDAAPVSVSFGVTHTLSKLSFMVILAVVCKGAKSWYLAQQARRDAEQARVMAELQLLRSQLQPHFLFNTLNNLYEATLAKSETAPRIVLKLADIMAYMLYDSRQERVRLADEINCLKEYVALEQLRYGNRLDVAFTMSGTLTQQTIAPLLLLPLVENAFKHGARQALTATWLTIDLDIRENQLTLHVINPCPVAERPYPVAATGHGIGLANIRHQLALLYGASARLETHRADDLFTATLLIEL